MDGPTSTIPGSGNRSDVRGPGSSPMDRLGIVATERKRSGRRPGSPDTRQQILSAARSAFAVDGFERSSIRRIATDAGVDPALVHHYFGTKDNLFLAAVEAPFDPSRVLPQVFAEGIDQVGEGLVSAFITLWDSPDGERAVAFLRSAVTHPDVASLMRQFLTIQIIDRVLGRVDAHIDHRQLRGGLVASQLLGLAFMRYLLRLPPLVDLPADRVARLYGPTVQRYITMDAAELTAP